MLKTKKYCIKIGKKCKKLTHSQIRKLCIRSTFKREKPFITIILGAGAAKIWNGPITSEIDTVFIENMTYTDIDGTSIGAILFEKLRAHYGREGFVNFETFINLLELIYDYVISDSNEGGTDPTNTSSLPLVFDLKVLVEEIYNPENQRVPGLIQERDPIIKKRIYFGEIIRHYLNLVKNKIDNYENLNDLESPINMSVFNWLSSLTEDFIIRIYTTNYDRIIPEILEKNNFQYFDGFFNDGVERRCNPDIKRICHNSDKLVYYQLHGSNHWEIVSSDFSPYDYLLIRDGIPRNEYTFHLSSQLGQVLLKTSIIAGYSKPQRLILSPINAMYSSFVHDCLRSSYILTSGFSFGDPHLKKVFINCLDATNTKFINITNKVSADEVEELYGTGIYDDISRSLSIHFNNLESVINGNWVIKDNRYFTYYGGFASFLETEAWDGIT